MQIQWFECGKDGGQTGARRGPDGGQTGANGGQTGARRGPDGGQTGANGGQTGANGGQTGANGGQTGADCVGIGGGGRDGVGIRSLLASIVVGKRGARRGAN
jgi:transcription initiation factor TFIID subunit 15